MIMSRFNQNIPQRKSRSLTQRGRLLTSLCEAYTLTIILAFGSLAFTVNHGWAQRAERPAISESFSTGELTLTAGAILGLGVLTIWGEELVGPHGPSMGAPAEGSNDLRFSRWAQPDFQPGHQWLKGTPDIAGYAVPALTLSYYIGGSLLTQGRGWGGAYPHEALALTEGLSWAMLSTTILKRLVGRERPYIVRSKLGELDGEAVNMSASEQLLSFPSGHSAAIAATTFFIGADVSDALLTGPLVSQPTWMRVTVGHTLPYLTAALTSWVVMYSRVKDQRHWLSDTLTGALIGVTSSMLSYHLHFNSRGVPHRR